MPATPLILRFLGEPEVVRGGRPVPLPPSRKTRALLAYLAVTGRAHRRARLCALLWDVADDPRGALRWSLAKLRSVVNEPGRERIAADRDGACFRPEGALVDVLEVRRRIAPGAEALPAGELEALAAEFRGEFLEGLNLPDFHDFQAWCVAEREEARKARAAVLGSLVRRLDGSPEAAIPHARALVQVDPLGIPGRASLLRLLAAAGRLEEAEQHYEAGCRLLAEFGHGRPAALDAAWDEVRRRPRAVPPRPAGAGGDLGDGTPTGGGAGPPLLPGPQAAGPPPLAGRDAERAALLGALEEAASRRGERSVLILGEPGIGKTSLLAHLAAEARRRGGIVLEGRSFEGESGRPYGPWIDALRRLAPASLGAPEAAALAPLLGGAGRDGPADPTRERLFGAVADFVAARAAGPAPLLVVVDDAHWCDAASAELLHYVARMNRHRAVLIALAAREGEMVDNDAVRRLVRGLRAEGIVEEVRLGPLNEADTIALASSVAPGSDGRRVFRESGGNPLFALEAARAGPRAAGEVPPTLSRLVRDRIGRLPAEAAEVLRWAAALGCAFSAGRLESVASMPPDRLLAALGVLERHALLHAGVDGRGEAVDYAFAHEVVRRVAYADLSGPRRRLMHAKIARVLTGPGGPGEEAAADLAHHAVLAGEPVAAARACVVAGRRCLRLYAGAEAYGIARRGARLAEEAPDPERTRLLLDLAQVRLAARRPDAVEEAAREVEALAERALDLGCPEHARLGFHLLGWLRWEQGDAPGAQRHLMRAEEVSRSGGDHERVVALAEAARCLALLERDLGGAEALAAEAGALSRRLGVEPAAVADASGMLRLHEGRLDEAAALFRRARVLAEREGDPMGAFQAIEHLAALELQRGDPAAARRLAADLTALGSKLREGSEAPFARALEALCRLASGEAGAIRDFEAAIEELRCADAKQRLAFVLTRAAVLDLRRGDAAAARGRAAEALVLAEALGRASEAALARAALARAAADLGDAEETRRLGADLDRAARTGLSAEARAAVEALARRGRAGRAPARGRGAHP